MYKFPLLLEGKRVREMGSRSWRGGLKRMEL